jgi:hypothetical protein
MLHQVGQPVQYVPDEDCADEPRAAQITKVHADERVCLVYWCPESKAFKEAFNVAHFDVSNADTNEPYFLCLAPMSAPT